LKVISNTHPSRTLPSGSARRCIYPSASERFKAERYNKSRAGVRSDRKIVLPTRASLTGCDFVITSSVSSPSYRRITRNPIRRPRRITYSDPIHRMFHLAGGETGAQHPVTSLPKNVIFDVQEVPAHGQQLIAFRAAAGVRLPSGHVLATNAEACVSPRVNLGIDTTR